MIETELEGGVVGTIIDARGRPLVLPEDPKKRREHLDKWFSELNLYPSN